MTNDIHFDLWITNSVQRPRSCHGLHAAHFPSLVADATLFKTILIIFADAPQIIISQVQSSYNEGSAVNVICTASGTPHPDVQWLRNGKGITSGTKAASLMFSSINRTDDGQYTCKATNSAGSDENQATLVVYCK